MTKTAIAAVTSALALTVAPAPAAAQPRAPVEQTRDRAIRPNRYLLGIGVGTLAAAYIPSVVIASSSSRSGDEWLYAPVIGPWADLGAREPCAVSGGSCDSEQLWRLLLVTSGIVQIVGAVSIATSFVIPEYRPKPAVAEADKPEVRVTPMAVSKSGYGLGVYGRW